MPAEKRELVDHARNDHALSFRQACLLFSLSSSVYYYQAKRKDDTEITTQLSPLGDEHKCWGFWMMFHRLRNLGHRWNHKRVYRVYTHMRLNLRSKRKKRLPARIKAPLLCPVYPNITWSLDFMHDTLMSSKSIRSLNIIDDFNREVLTIAVDSSLPSGRVIRELDKFIEWRGKPDKIRSDNGSEFISDKIALRCSAYQIEWEVHPTGKAYSE